ncbi:MAG: hypothetical protein ACR2P0_17255, partial [Acidimicrobiales bacterium]
MAQPDMGLATAVDAFIEQLMATLEPIASSVLRRSPDELRRDLALDAFNTSAAFIDCDESHSDQELEAFVVAIEHHLPAPPPPKNPTKDVREEGLLSGKRSR